MDTKSFSELEKIIDKATDAIEYKLVVSTLISMLDKMSFDAKYDLRQTLRSLLYEYDSKMSIESARKKAKVAIKAVSFALQSN